MKPRNNKNYLDFIKGTYQIGGKISTTGYKRDSKDVGEPNLTIPGNRITMKDVDFPVMARPSSGSSTIMYPNNEYYFPNATHVKEIPMRKQQQGGQTQPQDDSSWLEQGENQQPQLQQKQRRYMGRKRNVPDRSLYQPHPIPPRLQDGGMNYILPNGQMFVEQNQGLPPDYSVDEHLRNSTTYKRGGQMRPINGKINQNSFLPAETPTIMKNGGYTGTYDTTFNSYSKYGGKPCASCGGKMQVGGNSWMPGSTLQGWNKPTEMINGYPTIIENRGPHYEQSMKPNSDNWIKPEVTYGRQNPFASIQNQQPIAQAQPIPSESNININTHPLAGMDQYSGDVIGKIRQEEMKKGGWIKSAINPKHKGYCTPMSKPTCTGHRRALAERFKHGDLHKKQVGGTSSWDNTNNNTQTGVGNIPQDVQLGHIMNQEQTIQSVNQDPNQIARAQKYTGNTQPGVTGMSPTTDQQININTWQAPQEEQPRQNNFNRDLQYGLGVGQNLLATGLAAGQYNEALKNQKYINDWNINKGMSSNLYKNHQNPLGSKGTVGEVGSNYGMSNPTEQVPGSYGRIMQMGGAMLRENDEVDLSPAQIKMYKKLGYSFQKI